jgi:RNA polymerase sigma factor (sigma-70 family)
MKRPDIDDCAIAAARADLPSDADLLRRYAATEADECFSDLVERYVGLVYSAAFRQTRDHATSQDVTQVVFTVLARKAGSLARESVLAGWLVRATRYAVLDALKLDARRLRRERAAAELEDIMRDTPDTRWDDIAPLLDEALHRLSTKERNAVVLRFFEKRSWKEIGDSLGLNENAARVRVGRAVEKLRSWFRKRGVTTSTAALSAALLSNAVQAAPAGLLVKAGAGNAALVTLLLKRLLWHRILPGTLGLLLLTGGIAAWWLLSSGVEPTQAAPAVSIGRNDQQRIAREVRAVLNELDRGLFFNDPQAFVGQIHFRTAEEERFRPLLAEYARVSNEFRAALAEVHTSGKPPSRTYRMILDDLFAGQPGPGPLVLGPTRAIDNAFRTHSLHVVKTNGAWKWDYFGPLTSEEAAKRMPRIATKIETMKILISALRERSLTNAYEALDQFKAAGPR